MSAHFDTIIIGGGHAGVEAAWAGSHILAPAGKTVALITMDPLAIGRMSCNPAIGGLAKGQMVREIDALGGLMAHAIDHTGIQFRMLNRSKGPAVQSPRAQADKYAYATTVQQLLKAHCRNLTVITGIVDQLLTKEETTEHESGTAIAGVALESGLHLTCRTLVLTTGTFLRALMHTGEQKTEGGRINEPAAKGLSTNLRALGFELGRLKTGTPPRLARESIDFSALEVQLGDTPPVPFSDLTGTADSPLVQLSPQSSVLSTSFPNLPQLPCHITYTNQTVHDLVRQNLHRAPMYSGQIEGRGPRYCPSLEDKIVRFADKQRHQLFLEPEGLNTNEIYANGISTSLPADVQEKMIHSIAGLERAQILKWGYAVEYDFSPTHQIDATLETRLVEGLFFAGQLNGTSGYEEAAGQGLVAGINAARRVLGQPRFTLTRDQAYIGVMIDDLITKVPTEPYRMFTSRAEFRLTLRSDNTDQRLTPLGHQIGLGTDARLRRLGAKVAALQELTTHLKSHNLPIGDSGTTAYDYLRRPDINWQDLPPAARSPLHPPAVWEQMQIEAKYSGYIEREKRSVNRMIHLETKTIPVTFDFSALKELRKELRDALVKFRPQNIGQASRLEGITPGDLTVLMVYLTGRKKIA